MSIGLSSTASHVYQDGPYVLPDGRQTQRCAGLSAGVQVCRLLA